MLVDAALHSHSHSQAGQTLSEECDCLGCQMGFVHAVMAVSGSLLMIILIGLRIRYSTFGHFSSQ